MNRPPPTSAPGPGVTFCDRTGHSFWCDKPRWVRWLFALPTMFGSLDICSRWSR